jgi:uncharacterized protein YbaR (Trm112 family)
VDGLFIELTDHLRCPVDHEESFLVLLPDKMEGRSVVAGQLGCPVCGRTYALKDGAVDFGGAPEEPDEGDTVLDAAAVNALTGLHGPGGYLTLVGNVGSMWQEIAELNPGVALVAVNPPASLKNAPQISVLRAGRFPLKSGSMRGVVLGKNYGSNPDWVSEAARAVLPGLRVVGEGTNPSAAVIDLMASADGVWVGTRKR